MNKKIILALVCSLFLTLSVTSCKKERTCVCTTTETDLSNGASESMVTGTTKIKNTKKKAKSACEKLNSSYSSADSKVETKCEIQ